jgi:hypothetical protein
MKTGHFPRLHQRRGDNGEGDHPLFQAFSRAEKEGDTAAAGILPLTCSGGVENRFFQIRGCFDVRPISSLKGDF